MKRFGRPGRWVARLLLAWGLSPSAALAYYPQPGYPPGYYPAPAAGYRQGANPYQQYNPYAGYRYPAPGYAQPQYPAGYYQGQPAPALYGYPAAYRAPAGYQPAAVYPPQYPSPQQYQYRYGPAPAQYQPEFTPPAPSEVPPNLPPGGEYQPTPPGEYPQTPQGEYPQQAPGEYPQAPGEYPQQAPGEYPQAPGYGYPQGPAESYPQAPPESYPQAPSEGVEAAPGYHDGEPYAAGDGGYDLLAPEADCPDRAPLAPPAQAPCKPPPPPPNRCHPYAAGSIYFLRPYFDGNAAFRRTAGVGGPNQSSAAEDFDWNYEPAYGAWGGFVFDSGIGLRSNFFWFDQASQATTATLGPASAGDVQIVPPANPAALTPAGTFGAPSAVLQAGGGLDVLRFQSDLQIYNIDGEAILLRQFGQLGILLSGGGRYLHIDQNYVGTLQNQGLVGGAAVSEVQTLRSGHNFSGGGPTASLAGNWFFGPLAGLALYGNVRGSLLVGEAHQTAYFTQTVDDPAGVAGGSVARSGSFGRQDDQVLPVLEAELGLQFSRPIGAVRPFVRTGVVNKTYFNAGNASSTNGSDLSLFGGVFSAGLQY